MNGRSRVHLAAKRQGWTYDDLKVVHSPRKMTWTQRLSHEDYGLMMEIEYCGFTIKSAVLIDEKSSGAQVLKAQDRDKAARIEDVLLGNGRRF